jgi:hypothetical protein
MVVGGRSGEAGRTVGSGGDRRQSEERRHRGDRKVLRDGTVMKPTVPHGDDDVC